MIHYLDTNEEVNLYSRRSLIMSRDAIFIALALCRYRDVHGRWPESVEEAVDQSDPKPMRTEYYGAPFVYRIVDGYPLLYALGDDFEDNGGRPGAYPIYSPDGTAKWDRILLRPPGYVAAFNTIENARASAAALITRRKRVAEAPDATPRALNNYPWTLLTCEPEDLRDPQTALPVAKRAVAMTEEKNFNNLDTLALAYFMTGDAAKAVETQERAVSLLPPEESPLRTELETSLAKYRAALPEHDASRAASD
jgi:hypothetical protein